MKILLVCPDFPYPPNHGGRVDVWSRILVFSSLGFEIDLLVTERPDKYSDYLGVVEKEVRSITWVPREKALIYPLFLVPYQVASRRALRRFITHEQYDVLWLETEAVANILAARVSARLTVLRSHNNEASYFSALAQSERSRWRKVYYRIESLLYRFRSPAIKKRCDRIAHISSEEFARDGVCGSLRNKCVFLPPHVDSEKLTQPRIVQKSTVLFVGNLFMPNNLAGLRWYLKEVDPLVRGVVSEYRLVIAGNTRGVDVSALAKSSHVTLVESPSDLSALYAEAAVFVNPMRNGAGVKLKTINAMEKGVPVVSTMIGAEGIGLVPGRDFALADDARSFAAGVIGLLHRREEGLAMASRAQSHLKEHFNAAATISQMLSRA